MDHSIQLQQSFWNTWNAETREQGLSDISRDQKEVVVEWLAELGRTNLDLIDVGCGSGWLCPSLKQFGRVTATDIASEVLARARRRIPDVKFVAGDFMELGFPAHSFDAAITIEVLSHIENQPAFIARIARCLRPGGRLILATQNRPVMEHLNSVAPPRPGQLRRWVDRKELAKLLAPHFLLDRILFVTPNANKGLWRLLGSRTARRLMRSVSGRFLERVVAAAGLGRTLMAMAYRR
jgi:2-polyprenyl-3-methyl-5-hydroxy-6-metoxy-1,4-benzoquinol methylase